MLNDKGFQGYGAEVSKEAVKRGKQLIKKKKLLAKIKDLKEKKYTIAGVGAGAKANTFLTYYNLNNKIIDFLTDNSKYKQNKITPVTRIIIKDDNEIKKYKKIALLSRTSSY